MEAIEKDFILNNEEFGELRTFIDQNGGLWIAGVDVARALGYKNPSNAVKAHCIRDKIVKRRLNSESNNGVYELSFIESTNFCRLVTKSTLPSAEKLQDWVFEKAILLRRRVNNQTNNDTPELLARIKELEKELDANRFELTTTKNNLNTTREELRTVKEKLETIREASFKLTTVSSIAKFYKMDEPVFKSLLLGLGVDIEKLAFNRGGDLYIDLEIREVINTALSRNFNREF